MIVGGGGGWAHKWGPNDDDNEYDTNYVASAGDGMDNPTINKTIMMVA